MRDVLSSLRPAPAYYPRLREANSTGPPLLASVPTLLPLPAQRFERQASESGTLVLDLREIEAFGGAHLHGALNIALREEFPLWAGWMVQPEQHLLLVMDSAQQIDTAVRNLLRVGLDKLGGYLAPGIRGWFEAGLPIERCGELSVQALQARLDRGDGLQLLDVRADDEWEEGHIPTARHMYAPFVADHLDLIDRHRPVATYCSTGYRASIAASVLERAGFAEVCNVPGSMRAWQAAGYPIEKRSREHA